MITEYDQRLFLLPSGCRCSLPYEDTDEVITALQEIDAECVPMPAFAADILAPDRRFWGWTASLIPRWC